ncbi:UNVERIFIED_CONTAM: hypothetical protein Scaly_3032900 [Sesamum calycinum]|uniref:Reverse transcriptase Ty1/copia-type domain-containing protein n=1 Tax=Sesamum calycinum TaxID=2727403 RepID=A0AAW2K9E6_9LAMI
MAAMESISEGWPERSKSRTLRLGIESSIETCTSVVKVCREDGEFQEEVSSSLVKVCREDETASALKVPIDSVPVIRREAMSDIDSDKWLETKKSQMDSMGSNQVWTLVEPPKGVKPIERKWVYKCKLRDDGVVTTFKAKHVAKEEEIYMDKQEDFTYVGEEQKFFRLQSSKQATTADSAKESDYIVALEATKEAVWMKNYIQELGVVPRIGEPVVIYSLVQVVEMMVSRHGPGVCGEGLVVRLE